MLYQVGQVLGSSVETLEACWDIFRGSYKQEIMEGRLTRAMVWTAAGQRLKGAPFHYGVGRRLVAVGREDGFIGGALIARDCGVSTQVEWIGVNPDSRRQGIGSLLLDFEKDRVSSQWNRRHSVTVGSEGLSWTKERTEFLQACGFFVFQIEGEMTIGVFDAEDAS